MTAGPRICVPAASSSRQKIARFERTARVVAHHRAAPRNPRPRRYPRRRQPGPDGVVLAGHRDHQAQVDDLDRLVGGGVAVAAVVLGVEGFSRRRGVAGKVLRAFDGDRDGVLLAAVAQVGGKGERAGAYALAARPDFDEFEITLTCVMPALVAGIHVLLAAVLEGRRGWPGQARP